MATGHRGTGATFPLRAKRSPIWDTRQATPPGTIAHGDEHMENGKKMKAGNGGRRTARDASPGIVRQVLPGGLMLLMLLGTASARAEECAKAVSTMDIVQCQTGLLATADRTLNETYKKAIGSLPDDQGKKLQKAERLWIQFRDADCDVFYGKDTGTLSSVEAGRCMIDRSRQRDRDLKQLMAP
ncbi:lysozyme inhibitor LprI family protein [Rhizosaccharibacter radicis]|uniref:Lysozyme inhibitor LprI family protein n=1 Tax=Rhizosaccharibacter radicis TaxID=2782605 RepID=A0ABT1W328_9PROT|nr:lysozyme inhibitor LprI family protein [Acetobacteraceae bacterium KSS12]